MGVEDSIVHGERRDNVRAVVVLAAAPVRILEHSCVHDGKI